MTTQILPLGSIIRLNDGDVKLMVISRFSMFENKDEVVYLD